MKELTLQKIEKQLPPGVDAKREVKALALGLVGAVVYSFSFLWKYVEARNELFIYSRGVKKLMEGAVMPPFVKVLNDTMDGFLIFFVLMIFLMFLHYVTYYKESKAIYLMKRLPDKWELYRRCVVVPLVAILIQILIGALTLLIYYGVYILFTPAECLMR